MTKEAVIHEFFNSFGIPAYPSSSVPQGAELPWITYDLVTGDWRGEVVSMTVNIWYYTTDENEPNEKAREIGDRILDEKPLKCDEGYVWLKKGSPFCQSLTDDTDSKIKRRYMNINAEYFVL